MGDENTPPLTPVGRPCSITEKNLKRSRLLLFTVIAILVVGFFAFDLGQYFSLEFFKSKQADIDAYYGANPGRTALIFFLIYVAVTGLSLPGAALMTLVAGAIFGIVWGTVIVSFASTIGATLAFLASRFLFRDVVQRRFGRSLVAVNRGVEKDGAFYLFTLRLVPAFPFFVINLVMGLTPIGVLTFFLVSQVGMFAGTVVYVNAGTHRVVYFARRFPPDCEEDGGHRESKKSTDGLSKTQAL